jgi:hypothetical protein
VSRSGRARAEPALAVVAILLAATFCGLARADFRDADRQRALEIGLRLADLGKGWSESAGKSPRTVDAGTLVGQSVTAECGADSATAKTETNLIVTGGSMSSFARPGGSPSLVSLVMLFKTPYLARREAAAAHDLAKLRPCLESQLEKALGGVKPASLRITPLPIKAPSLDAGYRIVTRLGGTSTRIYLDLLVDQGGRGLVETALLSLATPAPTGVEQRAAAVVARRLARYA